MNTDIRRELKESAKDFIYFGYTLRAFLNYESFNHIDKDVLRTIYKEAYADLCND